MFYPFFFFFFNDTATTEIYTLSLHDALPIRPGRLEYGAALFAFDTFDIGPGHGRRWKTLRGIHSQRLKSLGHPGRADGVDPDAARRLERRRSCKTFETAIDEADGGAPWHGRSSENTARQREGPAVTNMRETIPDQVDLSEEFIVKRKLEIGIAQLIERGKLRVACRANDGIHLP